MTPHYADDWLTVYQGDARTVLATLPAESVDCCVTSPPYWGLRDYGTATWSGGDEGCDHRSPTMREGRNEDRAKLAGSDSTNGAQLLLAARTGCGKCGATRQDAQLGLEATPEEYVANLVAVFREVKRVLKATGTLWLNLGDSYAGSGKGPEGNLNVGNGLKPKDLVGIPWRVAFALQADGWYLRSDIIWAKPNPMPESVTDRPTKSHEYLFLLAKGQWKSRIVELADTPSKNGHLRDDLGPNGSHPWAHELSVRLAAAILDTPQFKQYLSLSPLDAKVGEQGTDGSHRHEIGGLPVEHRAAVLASRLLGADCSTKEFLRELNGLGIALADRHNLLIGGSATEVALPPGIYAYGEGAIAIEHPGEIREFDFLHNRIIASAPTTCSYYYDADAVREAHAYDWTSNAALMHKMNAERRGRYDEAGPAITGEGGRDRQFINGPNPAGRNLRSVWYDLGDENLPNVPAVASRDGVLPTPESSLWPMQEVLGGEGAGMAADARGSGEGAPSQPPLRPDGGRPRAPEGAPEVGAAPTADGGLQGVGSREGIPAASEPVQGGQGSGSSVLRFGEGQGSPASEAADATREGERREVQAQAPDAVGGRIHADGCRMGEHQGGAVGCVCVLHDGSPADYGSLPAAESRRVAHPGECCGCLSPLQQQQEGADRGGVDRGGLTDLWTIATKPYKGAHFAVFPPELPERCIKAGSSERGVCPECGKPWERAVELGAIRSTGGSAIGARASNMATVSPLGQNPERGAYNTGAFVEREHLTTGWQPSCRHETLKAESAIILDPFAGSGTVGLVANRLSRRAILIDLNAAYLEQQMRRNAQVPVGL